MSFRVWMIGFAGLLLVARPAAAAPEDTVHLKSGGRVRGTVMVEDPNTGVKVQLADGTVQQVAPAEVERVEYGSEKVAPAPGPAVPAAPAPTEASPEPSKPSSGGSAFAIGAVFGPAFGETTAFRLTAYLGLQLPLSTRWSIEGRIGTIASYYSYSQRDDGYGISSPGGESYYSVEREETSGQLGGLTVGAYGGFALGPTFSLKAGALAGYATGTASADSCDSFTTPGMVLGFGVGASMLFGARRNLELGLGLDALVLPSGSCTEAREDSGSTTSFGRSHVNDDDFVFNPAISLAYLWR